VQPRARVQRDDQPTHRDVRERERRRVALGRVRDDGRERTDREHPAERQDAVDDVVRVEAVGVEGEPDPRPPDRHEEPAEHEEAVEREVVRQRRAELGDRHDEDEVEEELEPGRVSRVVVLERADSGRDEEPRARVVRHPGTVSGLDAAAAMCYMSRGSG
jgi:hypothetical protein